MKKTNKLLAVLLALTMCLSLLPVSAFAEEGEDNQYSEQIEDLKNAEAKADQSVKNTEAKDKDFTGSKVDYETAESKAGAAQEKATEAAGKAEASQTASAAAKDALDKIAGNQAEVNTAEDTAKESISEANEAINGAISDINTAVENANAAIDGVNEKLNAAEGFETASDAEKLQFAADLESAADAAEQAADAAKAAVEAATATVESANTALTEAKETYEAAVEAAQKAAGEQKIAAEKALKDAKDALDAAEIAHREAAENKAAADKANTDAQAKWMAAQELYQAAKEVIDQFEWPDDNIKEDSVDQGAVKTAEDNRDKAEAAAQKAADNVTTAQVTIQTTKEQVKKDTEVKNDLTTQEQTLSAIQKAHDEKLVVVNKKQMAYDPIKEAQDQLDKTLQSTSVLQDGGWPGLDVCIGWTSNENPGRLFKDKNGNTVTNGDFVAYCVKTLAELSSDSEEYKQLKDDYEAWKQQHMNRPDQIEAYMGYIGAAEAAEKYRYETYNPAAEALRLAEEAAQKVLTDSGYDTRDALDGKHEEVSGQLNMVIQEIEKAEKLIKDTETNLYGENGTATEPGEGSLWDVSNTTEKAAAEAKKHAKKMADLLKLKDQLKAAQNALKEADNAQKDALSAQRDAAEALNQYKDAQATVDAAKAAYDAVKNGKLDLDVKDLDVEGADPDAELNELAKQLKDAQDAAEQAKKDYEDAQEKADEAQEKADEARNKAQEILASIPVPDDDDDDGDTGDTGEVALADALVPLAAGPVTRGEFINYLWSHEGQPESAGVCTFTDVEDTHEYFAALCWAEENGIAVAREDGTFQPDELVTGEAARTILGNFAQVIGTNAVAVADLTTLLDEGDDPVFNCGEVLAEFFGEEFAAAA